MKVVKCNIFMTGPSRAAPTNVVKKELDRIKRMMGKPWRKSIKHVVSKDWIDAKIQYKVITWDYYGTNKKIRKLCGKLQIPVKVFGSYSYRPEATSYAAPDGQLGAMRASSSAIIFMNERVGSVTAVNALYWCYHNQIRVRLVTFSNKSLKECTKEES